MIFIFGAISTIFSIASGEVSEEVIKKIKGISANIIYTHEKGAEIFSILIYILGFISIVGHLDKL